MKKEMKKKNGKKVHYSLPSNSQGEKFKVAEAGDDEKENPLSQFLRQQQEYQHLNQPPPILMWWPQTRKLIKIK